MGTVSKGLRPGLYAITDSLLTPPESLIESVEAALRGGAAMVQYREKNAPMAERLSQARNLQALCRNARVPLLINDDPELAKRVGAAGAHLGQTDGSLVAARRLLGDQAILGITCHADLALARAGLEAGADYLAFGRFYTSSTKPGAPAASPTVLTEAKYFQRPLTAIGGVTVENAESLIRAGADMLAVVGGLFGGSADDIEQRARAFERSFAEHHPLFSIPE
ncbi:thiamine phosphate synthase [Marinobacter sp.]|uniref:thiamine phosphate synthase n=1 Tax=Marinobacter sp. TaxID=50741 RepID=UPI003567698A